ncbi:PH domain-containing protein [Bacillus wiedmannii]|uniref:PH domain-containing protein n=1 Tax=Bacillus wiedmannii TaxID=1890302 RepID=UPI000BF8193D|nr:PH domain-containing protein [Bacillus wiedmannii]PFY98322.1 hypothetical protein COL57_10555 [Bacillus wiedmannii]
MRKIEKLIGSLSEHLHHDEEIEATVMGVYECEIFGVTIVQNGLFIATDKRVIYYSKNMFGYTLEVFPYHTIISIEMRKGFIGYEFILVNVDKIVRMKWIRRGDINRYIEIVKHRMANKGFPQQQPVTVNTSNDII